MQRLTFIFFVALFVNLANAADLGSCEIQQVEVAGPDHQIIQCAEGTALDVRVLRSCSSSAGCSITEHCVSGRCRPRDGFNRCDDIIKQCSPVERCVDGVCR